MKLGNDTVVGNKCVRNDDGELSVSDDAKKQAWKKHYERLLDVEFPWDPSHLVHEDPIPGVPPHITVDMVSSAVSKMKCGKAAGPSGIIAEMLKAAGDPCLQLIADLTNAVIYENRIPTDWEESFIISLYKGKGEALERGNYRGLKLLDQCLKVVERIVEGFIRERVAIDDMQFGFMPGRGTTDAIFILRQVQEKYLAKNLPYTLPLLNLKRLLIVCRGK